MLLAHISAPLIGLVDTAVLGHMQGSHYLAGASFAALVITQIYWICGFVRMSATGLSAQAKGEATDEGRTQVFYQSIFSAGLLGLGILLSASYLLDIALYFSEAEHQVEAVIVSYFNVRIWGAPAALLNLALVGWLLGQQKARFVMLVQISSNLINVMLNLLFVFVFNWDVAGVAAASVIAEYSVTIFSLLYIFKQSLSAFDKHWLGIKSLQVLTKLNGAMLLRNLALQSCLVFMTFQGIRLGQQTAAINAVLMQFFVLISLGLDAIAYAVEAKVGEAKGASDSKMLHFNTLIGVFWSSIFALLYALMFVLFGSDIVTLLTDQQDLQQATNDYLVVIWCLPLIAHWCFLFDGVFVGLTRASAMRNSMILSGLLVYFPVWWLLQDWQNWALWIALLALLGSRGISLGGYYVYLFQQRRLID
ncbi:MATE family efflux transporter [Aliiglaciecola sp. LCG003]|uniref:MATE family efflux transporter n=1 Tax=Aliiglaciecola sp. LCG003 TaxID=3053655 RepID=UPI0025723677|nr:MATE family efflux transporter [Aliiglaciecola sp. LCG003]WJG09333.1 MATE family efflux transporter [Aliiglaciecola sp. LCG003]